METGTVPDLSSWEDALAVMAAEEDALRAEGRWTRGPHDLLSIIGRLRCELTHNRMLAWFLDPAAAHGLGIAPLEALLALLAVDQPAQDGLALACVEREVRNGSTIADLLVDTDELRVVFEVKLDAPEQRRQADRLVDAFDGEGETVFVFLTLDGRSPWTGVVHDDRWLALSWREVLEMMQQVTVARPPSGDAATTITAYLDSLRRIV